MKSVYRSRCVRVCVLLPARKAPGRPRQGLSSGQAGIHRTQPRPARAPYIAHSPAPIALRQADGARTTALFLAREEYSRIQWQADHNFSALPAGDIGWLGAPAVLQGNGAAYDVRAVAGSGVDASRLLTVAVYWQSGSQHGLVTFERLLVAHPLKGSDDYAGE